MVGGAGVGLVFQHVTSNKLYLFYFTVLHNVDQCCPIGFPMLWLFHWPPNVAVSFFKQSTPVVWFL